MLRRLIIITSLLLVSCADDPGGAGVDTGDGDLDAANSPRDVDEADMDDVAALDTDDASAPDALRDAPLDDAAATDADTGDDGGSGEVVTVLTVNLWNAWLNRDDHELRTEMVANLIDREKPDFVAVQEAVESDDIDNRVDVLAAETGYNGVYEMTHEVPFTFEEGIGVLTRWDVQTAESAELRHGDLLGATQRKVLGVQVSRGGAETWFFSTHLIVEDDEDKKADQAADVFDFMDARTASATFLAGDMNATPETTAMAFFRGDAMHEGTTGDLTDAWLATHPGDDGFTHPSDTPEKRIDYIYARGATPESCDIVLDMPNGGVYASDHLAVLCAFRVD